MNGRVPIIINCGMCPFRNYGSELVDYSNIVYGKSYHSWNKCGLAGVDFTKDNFNMNDGVHKKCPLPKIRDVRGETKEDDRVEIYW